jgi:7-cyano-7-deazaguanine synthase
MQKKAVVLLSGGLDSATVCLLALQQNFAVYALSFSYQQKHIYELESANKIAQKYQLTEHKIAKTDLSIFAGSALTSNIAVPKNSHNPQQVPITYVPARNTIFLSYALAYAESIGCEDIFFGANALDYSGYPDCRLEFIEAFSNMANLATVNSVVYDKKIKIHAPLLNLNKAEIVLLANKLGLDFSLTHSCYDPIMIENKVYACGTCDSCFLRQKGFAEAKIKDGILYQNYCHQ